MFHQTNTENESKEVSESLEENNNEEETGVSDTEEGSSHLNREIESNRDIFKIPLDNPEMFRDILYNLDSSYFNSAKNKYDYALRTYNNFMNPH